MNIRHLLPFLLLAVPAMAQAANSLQEELQKYAGEFRAQVGIAVIIDHMDTVLVNNRAGYPMLSVFKFHQALAVANRLHRKRLPLDTPLRIRQRWLRPDTWSPLREQCPEGDTTVTLRELLRYTLQLSDNNACDILFRRFGSPRKVERYVRKFGLRETTIRWDEAAMHRDVDLCYGNATSPLDAVRLIEAVRTKEYPEQEYLDCIFGLMETCQTGRDRLPAPLDGTDAIIGHKTGTSDQNARGQWIGTNDIGYVYGLPNRHSYSIAVFIKDSEETPETNAAIIAGISGRVFRFVSSQPPLPM